MYTSHLFHHIPSLLEPPIDDLCLAFFADLCLPSQESSLTTTACFRSLYVNYRAIDDEDCSMNLDPIEEEIMDSGSRAGQQSVEVTIEEEFGDGGGSASTAARDITDVCEASKLWRQEARRWFARPWIFPKWMIDVPNRLSHDRHGRELHLFCEGSEGGCDDVG